MHPDRNLVTKENDLIPGFYNIHVYVKKEAIGRPIGGIACLLRPQITLSKLIHSQENLIVVKTKYCTLISVYFNPDHSALDIIVSFALSLSKVGRNEKSYPQATSITKVDKPNRKAKTSPRLLDRRGAYTS